MRSTRFVFTCHRDGEGRVTDLCGGAHQDWSPRPVAGVIDDIGAGLSYAVPWSQGPIAVTVRGDEATGRWLHSSGRRDDANELDALAACTRHAATGRDPQSTVDVRSPADRRLDEQRRRG